MHLAEDTLLGLEVAVKVFKKKEVSLSDRKAISAEVDILDSLDHPNTIRLVRLA